MKIEFKEVKESSLDVGDLLSRLVSAANAKSATARERGGYHPSALAGCTRALFYDRISTPKVLAKQDASSLEIFELGHAIHERLQLIFKEHAGFQKEVPAVVKELEITGSMDGVFTKEDWVLEIKSIGSSGYSQLVRPKEAHVIQLHCYMAAARIPRAQLLYVNRDNGAKRTFRVHFSQETWDKIVAKINEVEQRVRDNDVPDREPDFFQCKVCPFAHICRPWEEGNGKAPVRRDTGHARGRSARDGVQPASEPAGGGAEIPSRSRDANDGAIETVVRRLSRILRVPDR